MYLTIVAPWGMICHTTIEKVTLPSVQGAFTVLHGHAPLLAQLTAGEVVYTERDRECRVAIRSGFARVLRDNIEVCVETGEE